EILYHTNPNSAPGDFSDSNADPDGDGYTNLEDYLNWLAGIHALCNQNGFVDLDLSVYAAGLHTPVYAVSAPTNGTVALRPDGHTARFTPNGNFVGEGRFQFVANDGLALTNAVSVMVLPGPARWTSIMASGGTISLTATGAPGINCLLQMKT